jgi:DNA polymerase, archaea type
LSVKQEEGEHIAFEIYNESEYDIIKALEREVARVNPDFIFTEDSDSFTFPYLIHRAEVNDTNLTLSREQLPLKRSVIKEGTSYFSYGRVYFKPTTVKLHGRIHLDKSNSFVWNESGLHGLYEIARICRIPLHTASRASIGKCLSSLQCYYATKKGILIPWKPTLAEHFKSMQELLIADRGGFIFEPEIVGVHENVAEFDFVSLYPNIMLQKNLSAETILCDCCPNSKTRVPELEYNICEKRTGIVPISLDIVLQKRAKYKQLLLKSTITNPKLRTIYDARQNSLKWILVTSFGYLGFNNAKFGRIDAHIAVCAFARKILLQAAKIAERHGFRVLHGIVDSLWIKKRNSEDNNSDDDDNYDGYVSLKESIEKETGFAISFEGIYKWIAFTHSKTNSLLPVPNRYFGVFDDGSLKIRGLEARRHDTPILFSKCQNEILKIMAAGNNIREVKVLLMPKVTDTFQKYCQLLKQGKVPLEELVFSKRLSKDSNEYLTRNTIENDVLAQLAMEGKHLKAGQILKYVMTDYYTKHYSKRRAMLVELIDKNATTYDVRKYIELVAETCNSVTEPFGYTLTTKQADSVNLKLVTG